MDHNFFLNHHRLPAPDRETAYAMLTDACYGMLNARMHDDDRIFLYYYSPNNAVIRECVLAKGYTYQHFLDALLLLEWNNRHRVREKLQLSHQRAFQGGKPLFESLAGTSGFREIRFHAFAGGAIRILFKTHGDQCAILTGFIKKSDNDGYAEHIPIAEQEWLNLLN